jgi:Fungal specific transcription factor domain
LPSREASQLFFDRFLLNVHPIVPICNTATLLQDYKDFWKQLSAATSVEVLVRILAILYTGGASSDSTKSDPQVLSLFALYEEIMRAINFTAYDAKSSSLIYLQGFLIMNSFRASELAPFSAFGFLPQAIRSAQSLRLHFNKDAGNGIDPEIKRRIWWHLLYLDVESTIANGLQGITRPDGFTTQLPSLYVDEPFAMENSGTSSYGTNQSVSPMMIAMQGHWQWASRMQSWFERMPFRDDVTKFSQDMHSLLPLLPTEGSSDWARTYIKMQIDRAYCMLGLRFWQLDQFKGTGCQSEVVR